MDYHQNARLTIHSREQLARRVLVERCTLKSAAASFHFSQKTAAKWVRRFQKGGSEALQDYSSRPRRYYRPTSCTLIEKALSLRRLRWNGWRIARETGLSRATISRILRRAGVTKDLFVVATYSAVAFSILVQETTMPLLLRRCSAPERKGRSRRTLYGAY